MRADKVVARAPAEHERPRSLESFWRVAGRIGCKVAGHAAIVSRCDRRLCPVASTCRGPDERAEVIADSRCAQAEPAIGYQGRRRSGFRAENKSGRLL
jgi:hypothetical protein